MVVTQELARDASLPREHWRHPARNSAASTRDWADSFHGDVAAFTRKSGSAASTVVAVFYFVGVGPGPRRRCADSRLDPKDPFACAHHGSRPGPWCLRWRTKRGSSWNLGVLADGHPRARRVAQRSKLATCHDMKASGSTRVSCNESWPDCSGTVRGCSSAAEPSASRDPSVGFWSSLRDEACRLLDSRLTEHLRQLFRMSQMPQVRSSPTGAGLRKTRSASQAGAPPRLLNLVRASARPYAWLKLCRLR